VADRRRKKVGDPKVAVAYIRVSTEEQNNGPEAQRAAISQWAEREKVRVAAWHEDRLSGSTPADERPGLVAALSALGESGAGLLVAAKRDRLARDTSVAAMIELLAQGNGARVATADGVSVDDTPEGFLIRGLLDLFAAYERVMIQTRTRAALRAIAARGDKYARIPPLGWRWEGRKKVSVPHEQELIQEVRDRRKRGETLRGIVAAMNASGRTFRGSRWHLNGVRRLLVREGVGTTAPSTLGSAGNLPRDPAYSLAGGK
jgi:DNA invertase Pin-like site-specific DNA recombinase